jgi:hypothetical protein
MTASRHFGFLAESRYRVHLYGRALRSLETTGIFLRQSRESGNPRKAQDADPRSDDTFKLFGKQGTTYTKFSAVGARGLQRHHCQ